MSGNTPSAVISLRTVIRKFRRAAAIFRQDQLTLYAAQASFFLLVSALPLLVLILNVSRLLSAESSAFLSELLHSVLPTDFHRALDALLNELTRSESIPLLSVTAATALWSASRGIAALERGLCGVYRIQANHGFLRDILRSLIHTAAFIILMPSVLLLGVFGAHITDLVVSVLPSLECILTRLIHARGLFLFVFLSLLFTLEHRLILRRTELRESALCVPGALTSAAGWILFSYLYSIYIRFFPRSSHLYGSMATLVILMLWLYFCMIIFLCGAEVNKLLTDWISRRTTPRR